ncbi:MAG: hypothetical protein JXB30_09370 [Anaerolineae bacterium]|nr:hypothetical protein [Anaerolineae bacterium]
MGHVIVCGILVWLWCQALRASSRHVYALCIAVAIGLGLGIVTELV